MAIHTEWDGRGCDLFVALHALKSHAALQAFAQAFPHRPKILVLTGTDLYRDLARDERARESLLLADRIVALQQAAPEDIPPAFHARTRIIYQSAVVRGEWQPPRHVFRCCVLGHLREEKDPFAIAAALALLPPVMAIDAVHAGRALSDDMARQARDIAARDARYRWVGELPHWGALRLLRRSHALVISSRMEGGAHVASEAIAAGVPVLASDIAGNRGMLGKDYPAYFAVGDAAALARLIERAAGDGAFLAQLAAAIRARRPLIAPAREHRAWRDLLDELGIARKA